MVRRPPDQRYIDQVYDAYTRLSHDQLVLFLSARALPTHGTDSELAYRLTEFDIQTYHFPSDTNGHFMNGSGPTGPSKPRSRPVKAPDLPVELLAEIMDHVGDWELTKAVGVPTSLPQPLDWHDASQTDYAILSGYLPLIRAADPNAHPPTKISATLMVRFGYVRVLEYFLTYHRYIFHDLYKCDLLPIAASLHGRAAVLSWWKNASEQYPNDIPVPEPSSVAEAIEGASRNGHVNSLDWWLNSSIPLEYGEAALEMASAKNRIEVLNWWKRNSKERTVHMKIGRVMDMASNAGHVGVLDWWAKHQPEIKYDRQAMYHASCHGKVEVLQWWLDSGLQLLFDPDALIGATRHNRPEVLEWWDKSGLPIQYRMCDIEEALEDAIGGGEAARQWWRRKGVDFNANDKEWMNATETAHTRLYIAEPSSHP
ncbi:uncharacterized protein PHACADRAFT_175854 [Phanerochaete carnosa HHB-10118-sp]|uniref:Uncharacterized protein n=1 Tax=Phanerochaete carnosa (strain HHB-10118-sp) TaxID=650164 RepID=K5WSQ2_PHACS|nr:uncharacterized protein PHACADRAFT_175854 [Phanerochaete carnosa HHB-10118-sp]EKM53432.1 hypothetical protein PHACADRAFT_175854 [Phanerochaete carnosa HHB-10118-sp]